MSIQYDVIVVGAGPAGLNAALVLGRSRRRVLVFDSGRPRNGAAKAVHGMLGHDGVSPAEIRRIGREEVGRYGVEIVDDEVTGARSLDESERLDNIPTAFEVRLGDGRTFTSRKLLLATGLRDELPDVDGARQFYGRGVYHCPYCDGWEHRARRLVAYGWGKEGVALALSLKTWSDDVTLCTDGEDLNPHLQARLDANQLEARTEKILRLDGSERLERVRFESGPDLISDALFFHTAHFQRSDLPEQLGCYPDEKGELEASRKQSTDVPGLYLAGDAVGDVQFVVVAAAEGATAAVAINVELQREDLR